MAKIAIAGNGAIAVPNYEIECTNCGMTPTVDVEDNGKVIHRTELCGPCCWGESSCLDTDEWN